MDGVYPTTVTTQAKSRIVRRFSSSSARDNVTGSGVIERARFSRDDPSTPAGSTRNLRHKKGTVLPPNDGMNGPRCKARTNERDATLSTETIFQKWLTAEISGLTRSSSSPDRRFWPCSRAGQRVVSFALSLPIDQNVSDGDEPIRTTTISPKRGSIEPGRRRAAATLPSEMNAGGRNNPLSRPPF